MRVDVEKYLVVGPAEYRDRFFSMIQGLGVMEFISPTPLPLERSHEIETIIEAIHILKRRIPVKQAISLFHYREALALASHIVETNEMIEKEQEKLGALEKEAVRIEPFGEFSVDEVHRIEKKSGHRFQYFCAKRGEYEGYLKDGELFYINSRHNLDYFVAISKKTRSFPGLIEMKIERSLFELREEIATSRRLIDMWEGELANLSRQERFLKQGLISALNRYNLSQAKERMGENVEGGELFMATGWVPKNKHSFLEVVMNELPVHFEKVKSEKTDRIPTYLENKGFKRSGEDLIEIYDTPSTHDKDPSPWVLFAFGLFFSMIVADAGYGLFLLMITLFLWYKNRRKGGLVIRMLRLSLFLSIGCILWGILSASFFSLPFEPNSHWRLFSVIDWLAQKKVAYYIAVKPEGYLNLLQEHPNLAAIHDPVKFMMSNVKEDGSYPLYDFFSRNALLEVALFIGVVHVFLGMMRYMTRHWAGAGWGLFLIGGYLYFPVMMKAPSFVQYLLGIPPALAGPIGLYLLGIGISLAFILALLQNRLVGLVEPMHVIGVFGDVMSYLRIYALGLASMILGATFNSMATKLPLFVGVFVIIFGHSVNIMMGLMSGVIHGLRLNFIEWYHYSFEGGGKKFKPLALYELD